VSGTSKHIADWSSAGFDPAKGTNFVALHVKGTDLDGTTTGVTCVCECVPSQGTPTPAFNDDDVVMQITSETTGIKITTSKAGDVTQVTTYDISGMTLETE